MKCLKCDSTKFVKKNIRFDPEIKGEIVEVIAPCNVCKSCNSNYMDDEQMDVLRRAAVDKYRELHNLLTSKQIIAYREDLGMSQSSFARYLNVGEASIKRWETYYIQEDGQDEHIRLKCDEAYAELNFLNIYWKRHDPDIYNGNRKFNILLMKNVILYLVQNVKISPIYLNKLLFYVDFIHYKLYGTSLTGARYVPLKYGPCPDQYRIIYTELIHKGHLKEKKDHTYEALTLPDLSLLDDKEKKTLDKIVSLCSTKGVKKIYELSHKEKAYTETSECAFISYAFAQDLLLDP